MSEPFVGFRLPLPDHVPALDTRDALARLIEAAQACERGGADAVLVSRPTALSDGRALDPYVVLGAVVAATSRLLVGFVASAVDERSPAMLAKVVTALDVSSSGRALCVLGPPENKQLSLVEFAEAFEVVRALSRVDKPSFGGEHFRLFDAWNEPRHSARPLPLGVFVPRHRGSFVTDEQAEALVALALRFGEYTFIEVDATGPARLPEALPTYIRQAGRLSGEVPLIAVVSAHLGEPTTSSRLARDLRLSGFDGVVVEAPLDDHPAHIAELRKGFAATS